MSLWGGYLGLLFNRILQTPHFGSVESAKWRPVGLADFRVLSSFGHAVCIHPYRYLKFSGSALPGRSLAMAKSNDVELKQ